MARTTADETPLEPITVEVNPRPEGPFVCRWKVPHGHAVRVYTGETLTAVDFDVSPEVLRQISRDISAGADKPRPAPEKLPPPAKPRRK
jgi:hypothetical protein